MMTYQDVLKGFKQHHDRLEERVQEGIEQYRKGYATLQFKDKQGQPMTVARVRLNQKTHDFKYGANLFMLEEFDSEEQNQAYKTYFAELFNMATLPFYWSDLEPEQGKPRFAKDSPKIYRRPAPDLCLDYCEAQGIAPKAHCLNYAFFTPEWAKGDVWKEKRLVAKHYRELAERYAHRIRDWEVVNETFWGINLPNPCSLYNEDDYVEWNFNTADRYFPANRLIINEGPAVWDNAHFYGNRSPYFMQIQRALRNGSRIDSIGIQLHMFYRREELEKTTVFYDPQRLYDVMDTYAKLGRNLQITELTIPAYSYDPHDEEIQAEIIRNIYSIWFSHPAMEAILYWNLVDGFAAWAPQGDMTKGENYYHGGLIRYDFTPKPAFHMVQNLFQKEWHTQLNKSVDGSEMEFKGFYGDYQAEIEVDGNTVVKTFHLGKTQNRTIDLVI